MLRVIAFAMSVLAALILTLAVQAKRQIRWIGESGRVVVPARTPSR